ncbi:MAG: M28 family metallopeptidase [Saprospiraceae bacterium]
MKICFLFTFCVLLFMACKENKGTSDSTISEESFRRYISSLSSDEFQGRKPFTIGETKTLAFLETEVKNIGLKPGNGSSYFQDVPMVEITGHPAERLILEGPNKISLHLGDQYVAYTQRPAEKVSIDTSEVVFCGFGIVAPEIGWNDYKDIDMKGKTALVLVNDPDFETQDSTLFKGKTMTYYGRWTYKYEEAARQGAAAIWIIHQTEMAGYPWGVVKGAGSGAKLNLESLGYTPCQMQGWISYEAATDIFKTAGLDIERATAAARRKEFKPIPLPFKITTSIDNQIRKDVSKNVIAMLPGTEKPDEVIIFSAHWDHFGIGAVVNGDSIYNGANDNASGSAGILAIAEALQKTGPFKRSIAFLWVTAEEQGLLGSAYYAAHPIFPPAKTIANINIDDMNSIGEMNDLSVIGYGQSEMETYAEKWAKEQGRYILPDQEPEKGYFFRSDHFNFAKIGIPALYAKGTFDHRLKGKIYAKEKSDEYRDKHYHQPSDEYSASTFEFSGILQDANLYMNVVKELADNGEWPQWKSNSEFKPIRDATMKPGSVKTSTDTVQPK